MDPPAHPPDYLRPPEVANRLGISTSLVLKLIKRGKLPAVRIGHLWRIPRAEFEDWLHSLQA